MIVHPLYHSDFKYVEPEIYGLAKYNIHYHELAGVNIPLARNIAVGNNVLLKDLCGEDLINVPSIVNSITEDELFLSSPSKKTTNRTKLQVSDSVYYRVFANRFLNSILFENKGGMITNEILEIMLKKEFYSTLSPTLDTKTFYFFLDRDFYVNSIEIVGGSRRSIKVRKDQDNPFIDLNDQYSLSYSPAVLIDILTSSYIEIEYRSLNENSTSPIFVKMDYFTH